ncbi:MAG: response regulator transcription factor [Armatimonadetes bacterium]|nr:response regulator transcription factor [Armatimonadota bacterium]
MTTLLLADDHEVVRQGMRRLLETERDLRVVAETGDGLEAVELVERHKPNVLIVDMMMPGLNGLEVTRQVQQSCPRTRVLILSMHANEAYVVEALRNGATGYALKDAASADLLKAVRSVAAGTRYLSPPLSDRLIEAYITKAAATEDPYDSLTDREREVLHLSAEGLTAADIADRLSLSPRTVESHRAHVMQKLELKNQTELIRYTMRRGIVE